MFISHDVLLDEKHFPFHESKDDNQPPNSPHNDTHCFWQSDGVLDNWGTGQPAPMASSQHSLMTLGPAKNRPHSRHPNHSIQRQSAASPSGPSAQSTTVARGNCSVTQPSIEDRDNPQPGSVEGTHDPSAVSPPDMEMGQPTSSGPERDKRVRKAAGHL